MQRITNCVIEHKGKILMIKKPRRGWWYLPGGKMDHEELLPEAVGREVSEETGLKIQKPAIRAILTHLIVDDDTYIEKRTMFLFEAGSFTGSLLEHSPEGELAWIDAKKLREIEMDEADRLVIEKVLQGKGIIYGTLIYNLRRELQSSKFETA